MLTLPEIQKKIRELNTLLRIFRGTSHEEHIRGWKEKLEAEARKQEFVNRWDAMHMVPKKR